MGVSAARASVGCLSSTVPGDLPGMINHGRVMGLGMEKGQFLLAPHYLIFGLRSLFLSSRIVRGVTLDVVPCTDTC